jgi:hypothetical protein
MTENVIENLEVRHDINVLLATAREGVTALEAASTLIHIPTREMAKIRTAVKKMREAAVYIENRAHNLPVKSDVTTKSALKDALKGATQEQIDRAYAILSGKELEEDVPADEDEDYLPPVEWNEG